MSISYWASIFYGVEFPKEPSAATLAVLKAKSAYEAQAWLDSWLPKGFEAVPFGDYMGGTARVAIAVQATMRCVDHDEEKENFIVHFDKLKAKPGTDKALRELCEKLCIEPACGWIFARCIS